VGGQHHAPESQTLGLFEIMQECELSN
jgi:hypothetical protein